MRKKRGESLPRDGIRGGKAGERPQGAKTEGLWFESTSRDLVAGGNSPRKGGALITGSRSGVYGEPTQVMLDAANRTENMKPDPMITRKLKALQRIANAKQRGDLEGQQKAQNEMDRLRRGIIKPIKKRGKP